MKTIYFARYDSRNFSFEAYGMSAAEAKKVLLDGLKTHTDQYNLEDDWWYPSDVFVGEFVLDKCYRDGSLIKREDA